MDAVDKVSLLKELEFYSRLLKKHEALKQETKLTPAITQQTRISQQTNKSKSFHSYKVVKNHCNIVSHFDQKYSFKKSTHLSIADKKKANEQHNKNFNSKYSLAINKVLPVNKRYVVNSNNIPIMKSKPTTNIINESIPCVSSNKSENLTYNTKDFIKEVESLTELIKKKTSSNRHKSPSSTLKRENIMHIKQHDYQNTAFKSTNMIKKEATISKTKSLVEIQSKMPVNKEIFINPNKKRNLPQQKVFNINNFVYKKANLKQLSNSNIVSLKNTKNVDELNDHRFQNTVSRSASRKVIFSDSKTSNTDLCPSVRSDIFQIKPSFSGSREVIMKLHMPDKVISSNRKVLKKLSPINKRKSPVLLKRKSSNIVKVPKNVKLKQTNTKYTKINKHLTPPTKRILPEHTFAQPKSSLRKIKKKVNNKYKVINKMLTPNSNKNRKNSLCTSANQKNKSLNMDYDTFIEDLNDSAIEKLEQNLFVLSSELTAPDLNDSEIEKLEQNLFVLSSELTAPPLSKEHETSKSKIIRPLLTKVNSKVENKRTSFKKSKSRISKYKIVKPTVSQKFTVKNMLSPPVVTPLKRERAVLVRRLFKSKNVIINKNASPTSYSAKMIKSKYLSLNKRKSSNCQKYVYPTVSQHPKFKGSYFGTKLHKQKRFKPNAASVYHSRNVRKTSYGCQTYKLVCKSRDRQIKNKIRLSHSPVVFIRGAKYAINLNGKTLRKLPVKGYTVKNFKKTNVKMVMRTPENFIKGFPASTNLASRVLNRSINRILTASTKKKLSKVNTHCMFYNRFGRCNRGVKCTYIHDPSKIAVCTRFLRGTCKIDGCPFSHEVDPGKMAICSFFLVGQCDKENCPYRHEKLLSNAVLCKDFVQGYCRYGKECKKAHILICPKYMQGECDKGSLCAFPHPPQKAKKNNQPKVEVETKPTEVLLEKVLRYFQQGGDSQNESGKNSTVNIFVPKQRRLEEQPSFIPLTDSPDAIHSNK